MQPLTEKQQHVLDFIKSYHNKHDTPPTYVEIQTKFGYKSLYSVQQFLEQLTQKGYLIAPLGESKKRALIINTDESDIRHVPLEGTVAAGRLTEAVQNREYITVPASHLRSGAEYFALKVKGDSMIEDCIMDGDLVVIRRQGTASNGDTVVAFVDGDATIKRYYKRKTGIELQPANSNYEIIKVTPNSEFKILGVLASVIRNFD